MEFSNSFYPLIFFICGLISFYLAYSAFKLTEVHHKLLGVMIAIVGISSLSAGLSIPRISFSITYIWASFFYLAIELIPILLFSFILHLTGVQDRWIHHLSKILYLWPLTTLVLLMTNNYHNLIWIESGPSAFKQFWFLYYLLNGLILTASIPLLFLGYYREKRVWRKKTLLSVFLAVLVPWIGRAIVLGVDKRVFPETSLVPLFFGISGVIILIVILQDSANQQREKIEAAAETIEQFRAEQNQRMLLEQELTSSQILPIKILKDRTLNLQSFYDLVLIGEKGKSEEEVIQQSIQKIKKVVGCDLILFYSFGESGKLELKTYSGSSVSKLPKEMDTSSSWLPKFDELRIDQITTQDEPFQKEKFPEIFQSGVFSYGLSNWVTVDDHPRGMIIALRVKESHFFSENAIMLFVAMVNGVSVILENEKIRAQIIAEATNEERVRIARDMHDSIAQLLNGMLLTIDTILTTNKDTPSIKFSLIKMKDSLSQGIREMRLFFYESRERESDTLDFPTLIRTRIQYVEAHSGMGVTLNIKKTGGYPPAWNTHLYMISNEALNNALLHSKANQVEINFYEDADDCVLEIMDDGFGINGKTQNSKGYGMKNIEERCKLINADLLISANKPQGTIVKIILRNTGKE